MKYLTLPRLPKYGPLWETAKDWRSTGKLPDIQVGGGPGPPGQEEEKEEAYLDAFPPPSTTTAAHLPPIPSTHHGGRPRSAPTSPFTALFTLGDLGNDTLPPPTHHRYYSPQRKRRLEDEVGEQASGRIPQERVPPRLGVQMLERTKMFLDMNGELRVIKEGLWSLVEADHPEVSKLKLKHVVKATSLMRHPVMPCLGGTNNKAGFHSWPEPIRDRNKGFRNDPELSFLYTRGLEDLVVGKKKRRYFQAGKLGLGCYPPETKAETGGLEITIHGDLLLREKMARYACMISNTSCIMTIHGMGIHGRLFIPGPKGDKPRFLEIQVYTPINCKTYRLKFHAKALESMFKDEPDSLKAGNKMVVMRGLARMMYFEYTIKETFVLRDGMDSIEHKTTLYKHTDRWHVNPYHWDPADERKSADDEEEGAEGGSSCNGEPQSNQVQGPGAKKKAKGGVVSGGSSYRRQLVEDYRREEALSLGLPPPPPEPRSNVLPLPVKKKGRSSKAERAGQADDDQSAAPSPSSLTEGPIIKPKEFRKRRVAVMMEEELRFDMKRHPVNMAEVRRAELRERRRREEEEAERQRNAWDKQTTRTRGLVVGYAASINGLDVWAMSYYFPSNPANLLVRVYDRHTCAISVIKLNLAHMARTIRWPKKYDQWDNEERKRACHQMLHMLRFQPDISPCTRLPPHEQRTASLRFESRSGEEVLLYQPPPPVTKPYLLPFQAPATIESCVPWEHEEPLRHKTYRQPLSCCLGGDLSSRGIRTFKPRCHPRREVGVEGRRMAGGAARVDGVYCLLSLWWVDRMGVGDEVFLHLYAAEAITKPGGHCTPNSSHRIRMTMEDVWMHTIGTGLIPQAMSAVRDEDVARFRMEKRQLIHENEKEAVDMVNRLAVLENELNHRRNSLTDGQVLNYREKIDEVNAELAVNRARRAELEHYDADLVKRAEEGWYDMMQFVAKRCRWANPDLFLDAPPYESIMGECLEGASASTLVPRLDTAIYQSVQRLKNRTPEVLPGESTVRAIMVVHQKGDSLYFTAYEPRTSARFPFLWDPTLHQATMVGWHEVTALERRVDLQVTMQELCLCMVVKENGTEECQVEVDDDREEQPEVDIEEDLDDITAGLEALLAEAELGPKGRARASRTTSPTPPLPTTSAKTRASSRAVSPAGIMEDLVEEEVETREGEEEEGAREEAVPEESGEGHGVEGGEGEEASPL